MIDTYCDVLATHDACHCKAEREILGEHQTPQVEEVALRTSCVCVGTRNRSSSCAPSLAAPGLAAPDVAGRRGDRAVAGAAASAVGAGGGGGAAAFSIGGGGPDVAAPGLAAPGLAAPDVAAPGLAAPGFAAPVGDAFDHCSIHFCFLLNRSFRTSFS